MPASLIAYAKKQAQSEQTDKTNCPLGRGTGIESYYSTANYLTRLVGQAGEPTLLAGLALLDRPDDRSSATTFSRYFFNFRRRLISLPILLRTSAMVAKVSATTGHEIVSIAILPHPLAISHV